MVWPEFAYVAGNPPSRGGYGKTHFQADQTTLQAVSQMGNLCLESAEAVLENTLSFAPLITFTKSNINPRSLYQFSELILRTLIKKYLSQYENLDAFLTSFGLANLGSQQLEILGELALPEGHIDIIIKEAIPLGVSSKIAIEVKKRTAVATHVDQLEQYVQAIGKRM